MESSIKLTAYDYEQIAEAVADKIFDSSFFSGTIRTDIDGMDTELVATLVIYRHKPQEDDFGHRQLIGDIYDIVPVWWEFNTYDEVGNQVPNDFQFSSLRPEVLKAVA